MDQSWLQSAQYKAVIGPIDSKIGAKRAALFYMEPEKYFCKRKKEKSYETSESFQTYLKIPLTPLAHHMILHSS